MMNLNTVSKEGALGTRQAEEGVHPWETSGQGVGGWLCGLLVNLGWPALECSPTDSLLPSSLPSLGGVSNNLATYCVLLMAVRFLKASSTYHYHPELSRCSVWD